VSFGKFVYCYSSSSLGPQEQGPALKAQLDSQAVAAADQVTATATAAGEQLVTAADQVAESGPEAAEVVAGGIKDMGATIGKWDQEG
jgi:hypothetical protein